MKIWVDEQERDDLSRLASPDEILKAVGDEAAHSGRVVAEIRIDGVTVDADAFRSLGLAMGRGAHSAAFTLTPLRTLLRESLDSAVEYSQKLIAGAGGLAAQFENGEGAQALPALPQLFDGVGWLIGVYDRCRMFMPVPIRVDEEAALKASILETLRLLVSQADRGDFPAIGQTLRRAFLPGVRTLAQRVKDLSGLRAGLQ
ncbi:MAG: hypothetical protein IJ702_00330 [Fretibacterium sp.]|nr:hypothetical protein [Fretibacterium sp.]